MKSNPEIRVKITANLDVIIRANRPDINLETPFYAVNWFSTKAAWLYHFYNFLAFRSLRKAGGTAFFKAKVTETILDDANAKRDFLLIVRYLGGHQFKSLVETTYFKIVSVFRIISVKNFTFGFTQNLTEDHDSKKSDGFYYGLHHFKTNNNIGKIMQQVLKTRPEEIEVKYAGIMIANMYNQPKDESAVQVPNLMDAILLFQARSEEDLRRYFASEAYHKIIEALPANFISLVKRLL